MRLCEYRVRLNSRCDTYTYYDSFTTGEKGKKNHLSCVDSMQPITIWQFVVTCDG